jgi:peptide/nickel transport system ATP-binding protein
LAKSGKIVKVGVYLMNTIFFDKKPRIIGTGTIVGPKESAGVVGKHVDKLYSIPGSVPNPVDMPNHCYFKDRCEMCVDGCEGEYPCEYHVSTTHVVSCYRCKEGGTQN